MFSEDYIKDREFLARMGLPKTIKIVDAVKCMLKDSKGKQYIDFVAGWNVVNSGYKNKQILSAMQKQLKKLTYVAPSFMTDEWIKLAEKLSELAPGHTEKCFRTTGGSESVDLALKSARAYTKKKKFISNNGYYHGHTFGALSVGSIAQKQFTPLVPGCSKIPAPNCYRCPYKKTPDKCDLECARALDKAIRKEKNVAAFITEPIGSNPGVFMAKKGYMRMIREICSKRNVLLIWDEIGTGFGRTGKMFASEHERKAEPDIITVAKGLSSGYMPIGATVVTSEVAHSMQFDMSSYSTFGWTPLAVSAALANIKFIRSQRLVANSADMGKYLRERLELLKKEFSIIGDVRGKGLMVGLELVKDQKKKKPAIQQAHYVKEKCLRDGLVLGMCDQENVLFFSPPLIVDKRSIDKATEILANSLTKVKR